MDSLFPLNQTGSVPHRSSVFVPATDPGVLVRRHDLSVPADWVARPRPGSVRVSHEMAAFEGLSDLVDVSGATGLGEPPPFGALSVPLGSRRIRVDNTYCASMVFVGGGPYVDLAEADPSAVRGDARLVSSGLLIGFSWLRGGARTVYRTVPAAWHAFLVASAVRASPAAAAAVEPAGGVSEVSALPLPGVHPAAYGCALFRRAGAWRPARAASRLPGSRSAAGRMITGSTGTVRRSCRARERLALPLFPAGRIEPLSGPLRVFPSPGVLRYGRRPSMRFCGIDRNNCSTSAGSVPPGCVRAPCREAAALPRLAVYGQFSRSSRPQP